ncbi:MAG TPA: sigma-70 family RNA polymerase sigma factor [Kofleriaceae bacterium]|jgi:RNA polymerase sigma-70 factor (ECF subfamily)
MPTTQPSPDDSDESIVARVTGGSRDAFEPLVRRHNQRLYRAARAITRSDHEAEDVVQQAWLDIYRNLRQFRGEATFATWATRIAVNGAIAHTRKQIPVAEVTDEASDTTPDDAAQARELGRLLETMINRLPQGNREVMVLRDVLELDTAETAHCLGITEEAVRVRLHRARAAFASSLMEQTIHELYSFEGTRCDRITHFVMTAICL